MVLGTGTLGWHADERRTGRYGAVHLNYGKKDAPKFKDAPVGTVGTLTAEIMEVGDLYEVHKANPPKVGDVMELGTGELFTDEYPSGLVAIGVKPLGGRGEGWMDHKALYRCSGQVVKLTFTPSL